MQAVVRTYSGKGARELFDVLEKLKSEVESTIRSVEGVVSYTLARTSNGGFSVTVCKDKRAVDQSIQKAKEFIMKNAPDTGAGAPQISEGVVIAHIQ